MSLRSAYDYAARFGFDCFDGATDSAREYLSHISFDSEDLIEDLKLEIITFGGDEPVRVYHSRSSTGSVYFSDYLPMHSVKSKADKSEPHIDMTAREALHLFELQNSLFD